MQNAIYKTKEFFQNIFNHYSPSRIKKAENQRNSILEKLASEHDSVSLVPLDEIEKEAGITETREDIGDYIPCCS